MERMKIFPTYINKYIYYEGDSEITLIRWNAGEIVYRHIIPFDTPDEAKKYFEEDCGA